ncbi:hypothetical protein N0V82_004094 [Gnomoniopsis sp. IMI 355080]|nr:hypothetical protein N0V82_004094 [Gnomoniopsis sp. IMI 355080]
MATSQESVSFDKVIEASKELHIEGFHPIGDLNPHLLQDLLFNTAGKHALGNAEIGERLAHAMVGPVAIFSAYFAYWPLQGGDMIEQHLEIFGIAVLGETRQILSLQSFTQLRRAIGICPTYDWADLVDFIVKLVRGVHHGHSPETAESAKLLYKLCKEIGISWSRGTSRQEDEYRIWYEFRTKNWVNAFASTRKALYERLNNMRLRDCPVARLQDAILEPLNPIDRSVWDIDEHSMTRCNIDAVVDFLVVSWPKEVVKKLRMANTNNSSTPRNSTSDTGYTRGGSSRKKQSENANIPGQSSNRPLTAKADWTRTERRVYPQSQPTTASSEPALDGKVVLTTAPVTPVKTFWTRETRTPAKNAEMTATSSANMARTATPARQTFRPNPNFRARSPVTPTFRQSKIKQESSVGTKTGASPEARPRHSPPQVDGAAESPTKKPRVYRSPTMAKKNREIIDEEMKAGCQTAQGVEGPEAVSDRTRQDLKRWKKDGTRLRRLAAKTQKMASKLMQMATRMGKKAAKLEEQADKMLQTKQPNELQESPRK